MNRNLLVISIIVIFSAGALYWFRYIGIELGVIISVAGLLINILPFIYDILFKPKASLSITDIHFKERSFNGIRGHQLEAKVISKGARIVSNLTASFRITHPKGVSPNLLVINISVDEPRKKKVVSEEIPLKEVKYGWVTDDGKIKVGHWKELRKDDHIGLIYPYEPFGARIGWKEEHSYTLLKVHENVEYDVAIEVKGEDPDGNTVVGKSTTTLRS